MQKYFLLLTLLAILSFGVLGGDHSPSHAQDNASYPCAATHYPTFGDCEAAPNNEVTVAYGVYNNRENDPVAVPAETVTATAEAITVSIGVSVRVVNDWTEAQSDSDVLQIVNNVPVEGALYTIFLPIGWTPDGSYPVALSGNGAGTSNNQRFYMGQELDAPLIVGRSTQNGSSGVILAISNAGGTESQGIDDVTYHSVEAFFKWIEANAGGDPERFVTAGASRGGGSALMWAINPLGLDYTVRGIFADVPPTQYGTLTQRSPLTYPSLAAINILVLKDLLGWKYGTPKGPGQNPSLAMEYLIGEGDADAANALSPYAMAEKLVGKDLMIGHGTHDAFFQFALFLEFDRRLNELGIEHGTVITVGNGHARSVYLWQAFEQYMNGLATGEDFALPTGRQFWIDTTPASDNDIPLADYFNSVGMDVAMASELPFTVEIPYQSGVGLPIDVSACGAPGADFSVAWTLPSGGDPVPVIEGTFDETECVSVQIPTPDEVGDYVWSFTYRGEEINPTNTAARDENGCATVPAMTTVTEQQPFFTQTYAYDGSLGFGIDQYVAQASDCMVQ